MRLVRLPATSMGLLKNSRNIDQATKGIAKNTVNIAHRTGDKCKRSWNDTDRRTTHVLTGSCGPRNLGRTNPVHNAGYQLNITKGVSVELKNPSSVMSYVGSKHSGSAVY